MREIATSPEMDSRPVRVLNVAGFLGGLRMLDDDTIEDEPKADGGGVSGDIGTEPRP